MDIEALLRATAAPQVGTAAGAAAQHMPLLGAAAGGVKAPASWAQPAAFPGLDAEYQRLKPRMAMQFPFELDTFQKVRRGC